MTEQELREQIAKELAFQTLQDEKLTTKSKVWAWVVKERFVDEWLGKTDKILALIKEVCWLKGEQELPESPWPHTLHACIHCIIEDYQNSVVKAEFKPCQEWEK